MIQRQFSKHGAALEIAIDLAGALERNSFCDCDSFEEALAETIGFYEPSISNLVSYALPGGGWTTGKGARWRAIYRWIEHARALASGVA